MNPVTSFLVLVFALAGFAAGVWVSLYLGVLLLACAVVIGMSLKMANVWQKFVVLRMGKLQGVHLKGPFFTAGSVWIYVATSRVSASAIFPR